MKRIGKIMFCTALLLLTTGCGNTTLENNINNSEISEKAENTTKDLTEVTAQEVVSLEEKNKENTTENVQKSETTEKDKKWVVDQEGYYEDVWIVDKEAWVEDVIHPEEVEYVDHKYCFYCNKDVTNEPNHLESFVGIDDAHASAFYVLNTEKVVVSSSWMEPVEHPEEGHWEQVWHEEEGHWE